MNQPVRRKTDAGRNGRESPRHDRIILWKTLTKSSECPRKSTEEPYCSGASMSSRSSRHAGTAGLRTSSNKRCSKTPGKCRAIHKMKTRPGGQPDGSSHMGAWGGWALAPNTADGEGVSASHISLVAAGVPHVQTVGKFFNLLEMKFSGRKFIARPDDWLR